MIHTVFIRGYKILKKKTYAEPKNKGTLVFLQELGVALHEEWQRIPKAAYTISSLVCLTGVVYEFLHMEVTSDIDLDSISFMCFR